MSHTWTNASVLNLAGVDDPVALILQKARNVALMAMEKGWKGPPFDPFELASILQIDTLPQAQVSEALLIQRHGRQTIEYNPLKPKNRIRYSVAHEIAHTLFPDFADRVRYRKAKEEGDNWQLELLCNLAAAEFLMPIGSFNVGAESVVTIDRVLAWRKQFEVSTEAMLLRSLQFPAASHCVFAASSRDGKVYTIDYVLNKSESIRELSGHSLGRQSLVHNCTAIGFTEKGIEKWPGGLGDVRVECAGIAPFPGSVLPRVVGILHTKFKKTQQWLHEVQGNALLPRGSGNRILAHVVSDSTRSWGAGFGKQVAKAYPLAARRFRASVESGRKLRLGEVYTTKCEDNLTVVQLIAQKGFGESDTPRIRYMALRECLRKVAALAIEEQASVHMPPIGTGYAGGAWGLIKELIEDEICRKGIAVTVYDLAYKERSALLGPSLFD